MNALYAKKRISSRRNVKKHLTKTKKDGNPRCATGIGGLVKVIPSDVWNKKILPYYKDDRPLPDLSAYTTTGRPRSSWVDASPHLKALRMYYYKSLFLRKH